MSIVNSLRLAQILVNVLNPSLGLDYKNLMENLKLDSPENRLCGVIIQTRDLGNPVHEVQACTVELKHREGFAKVAIQVPFSHYDKSYQLEVTVEDSQDDTPLRFIGFDFKKGKDTLVYYYINPGDIKPALYYGNEHREYELLLPSTIRLLGMVIDRIFDTTLVTDPAGRTFLRYVDDDLALLSTTFS